LKSRESKERWARYEELEEERQQARRESRRRWWGAYNEYLLSPTWQAKRARILERAKLWGSAATRSLA
jgi:hypothetical protein